MLLPVGLVVLGLASAFAADEPLDEKLIEELSSGNVMTLPQTVQGEAVNVNLSLNLISFKLAPVDGEWSLTAWQTFSWTNPLAKWDPAEFGGIADTVVPSDNLWHPHDFLLFNQRRSADLIDDTQVVAYASGMNMHIVPMVFHAACPFNFTAEGALAAEQACTLKFGPWVYAGSKMDVHLPADKAKWLDVSEMVPNNCWNLETNARRVERTFDCCPGAFYPQVQFILKASLKDGAPAFCTKL